MIRVILVDDHQVIREGVQRILERQGIEVVGNADDVKSAWQIYQECRPDVLIMDMSMPGSSGADAVNHIIKRDANAKIIVFSIHESPQLVERILNSGALGYVTKSCPLDELVTAVEQVNRRKKYISSALAQSLVFNRVQSDENPTNILSKREFSIFCLVAEGKNSVDIANSLFLAEKTVANYIAQIKHKLALKNPVEMTHLALKYNLIELND